MTFTTRSKRPITAAERARLAADAPRRYRAGATIATIAADAGRSYGFIRKILIDAGTVLRPPGKKRRTSPVSPPDNPPRCKRRNQPTNGDRCPSTIDRTSAQPLFHQLAEILRRQILDGVFPPGCYLPGEGPMISRYGLGRNTIRQAVAVLRNEGLTDTVSGVGTWVRPPSQRRSIPLRPGDRASTRMPTDPERCHHNLTEGVPIIEIHRADTTTELHPGDRVELIYSP